MPSDHLRCFAGTDATHLHRSTRTAGVSQRMRTRGFHVSDLVMSLAPDLQFFVGNRALNHMLVPPAVQLANFLSWCVFSLGFGTPQATAPCAPTVESERVLIDPVHVHSHFRVFLERTRPLPVRFIPICVAPSSWSEI